MDLETAWAAGFYEGEGSASFSPQAGHRRPVTRVMISSTDEDVLRRFHGWAGVGIIGLPRTRGHYKTQWNWVVGDYRGILRVLVRLMPFLGERRFEKAALVADYAADRLALQNFCKNGHEYQAVVDRRRRRHCSTCCEARPAPCPVNHAQTKET